MILVTNLIISSAAITPAAAAMSMSPKMEALNGFGQAKTMDLSAQAKAEEKYSKLPISFEANRGQTDASVKFLARGKGYTLFLTPAEAVLSLKTQTAQGLDVVRMSLKGANADPIIQGLDVLASHSNYMTGNDPKKWQTNVEKYSKVAYKQVYPGIDMIYYGNEGQLEYDFVVAPGANPGLISMDFQGAKNLELDKQGNLVLSLKDSQLAFNAPALYQKTGDIRQPVEGCFVMASNTQVRFKVGAYDKSKELIIDPTLVYSTYLGTTVEDRINGMAVTADGTVYMTGQTAVVADLFPGVAAHYQSANKGGAFDAFVIKLSPQGSIMWATYLGGAGDDIGKSIAVGPSGIVYICGSTTFTAGASFPFSTGAFQVVNKGGIDGFLTAVNADGNSLVYSTFIGGAGLDFANAVCLDTIGNAYVTGGTTSNNTLGTGLPATVGAYQTQNGGGAGGVANAFVAKFNSAGLRQYFTYLGGATDPGVYQTQGNAIAVDGTGNIYVTGGTVANWPTFPSGVLPLARAFKLTIGGAQDAFITKIAPNGNGSLDLVYSSYLGGAGISKGTAIVLDGTGNVYVAGQNNSGSFPDAITDGITVGFAKVGQTTIVGNFDNFVFKMKMLNTGHSDGIYCTFLGGSGLDTLNAMIIDTFGDAYVTGRTESTDFLTVNPLSINTPMYTAQNGTAKAFITEIGPAGDTRVWNTFIGGVTDQEGTGIAMDAGNNIYLSGWTNSADYPTAVPLFASKAGDKDGFITKISATSPALLPAITSVNLNFGPVTGSTTPVVIFGSGFTGVTNVSFGTVNAVSYNVITSTKMTAIPPAQISAGVVDVRATSPAGTTPIVLADNYTYYGVPVVTGVLPPSGTTVGGTSVVITGTGFNFINNLKFDVLSILTTNYVVNSSTKITANSPPHAAGVVHIVATNPAGSSASGLNDRYTYILPISTSTTPTPAPTITKVNPTGGVPAGGTTVIINGTGFTDATSVNFGVLAATSYTVNTSTQITAVAPAHASGPVDIVATTLNGSSAINPNDIYTYFVTGSTQVAPAITGVKPAGGTLLGGTTVQISGTGFVGTTKVTFDLLNAAKYSVNSSTQITAVTPPHAAGIVDIIVTTLIGVSPVVAADNYTYTLVGSTVTPPAPAPSITSISPTLGLVDGGTTVVITGTGFNGANPVTGVNGVKFGELNATSYTVDSNTQITAVSPAHLAGVVDIVVTSLNGSSAIVPADNYTYYSVAMPAPSITGLNPAIGTSAGGTTVVITGSGFTRVIGANGVKFGDLNAASYSVDSDNQITAVTNAHAVGVVDVVATSLNGSSAIVPADKFTYFLTPVVNGYFDPYIFPSPTTGSTASIAYFMAGAGQVNLRVYNEIGNLMYAQDERKSAGTQGSSIDVGRLAPGVYLYLLKMTYDNGSTEKYSKRKFVVQH